MHSHEKVEREVEVDGEKWKSPSPSGHNESSLPIGPDIKVKISEGEVKSLGIEILRIDGESHNQSQRQSQRQSRSQSQNESESQGQSQRACTRETPMTSSTSTSDPKL